MAEDLLKDQIDITTVHYLGDIIHQQYPSFDQPLFECLAGTNIETLELKARVQHVIDALLVCLPEDFKITAEIFERCAADIRQGGQELKESWGSFSIWPIIDYVGAYGLSEPQRSFEVLEKLTSLFTAEFAIRPFLDKHFELTYQQMLNWTEHDDEHVRRLASEGLRPRLPWAKQLAVLKKQPELIVGVLEKLKADPSLYVRRSVANNLNDISKEYPDFVLALCQQWSKSKNEDTLWIIRHGLRTLVKTGHPSVYPLLGYTAKPVIDIAELRLSASKIHLGESIQLSFKLKTATASKLIVDYKIAYVRANGKLSWKVYKWKNIETRESEVVTLTKVQQIRPLSTRTFYPGIHQVVCLVNGEELARAEFELLIRDDL